MHNIALLIIYNHRYDKNISRLEELYAGKFSQIFHIMPFYDGDIPNVIPVYESSYFFQSYITQAYQHIKKMGFTHYFIVADDMIINPKINEDNLLYITGIGEDNCFINDIREVYDWYNLRPNFNKYNIKQSGVEVDKILPNREEAMSLFHRHNLRTHDMDYHSLVNCLNLMIKQKRARAAIKILKEILLKNKRRISYPLLWGYSDVLLLTEEAMPKFATYCGAFTATKLFVEYAIPTSLVFSSSNIVTNKQIKLHGITQIYSKKLMQYLNGLKFPTSLQCLEAESVLDEYHYQLSKLLDSFPEDRFFIHPIKLSQWK